MFLESSLSQIELDKIFVNGKLGKLLPYIKKDKIQTRIHMRFKLFYNNLKTFPRKVFLTTIIC